MGERAEIAIVVGATGLAAYVGYEPPGLIGAEIAAVVPAFVGTLFARRKDNLLTVAEDAAEQAGMDGAALVAWDEGGRSARRVLREALEATWSTLDHDNLRALSYVLADGFQDDARIDVGQFVVKALREFGTAHVRVLGVAEQTERPDFDIDLARVVELLSGLAEGMPAIRAVLEEDGLHRQG